jgi:hypothetical protein
VRPRTGAVALLAALVATALAGCYPAFPQTQVAYDASDGVGTRVGDVRVLNAIVVSDDGEDGNFVATAVNTGSEDVELLLQFESGGEKVDLTIEVEARSTKDLGFGADGQLFLAGIDTPPGGLLAVYIQYGEEQGRQLHVPVLDGALEQYADLLPTPTPIPAEPAATDEAAE